LLERSLPLISAGQRVEASRPIVAGELTRAASRLAERF